jgi:hypothetical protein
MPAEAGVAERIAQEACAIAVQRLCRGGSWEALPHELAWLVVRARGLEFDAIEPLAERAEEQLAQLVDEAAAMVAESASWAWQRHLARERGDEPGAERAAAEDANAEARRILALVYLQVLEALDHWLGEAPLEGSERPGRKLARRPLPGHAPAPPALVADDVREADSGWGSMVA